MAVRLARLARLRVNEQFAIGLLRGDAASPATPALRRAFAQLRRAVSSAGWSIIPSEARYLAHDEGVVLALLTHMQRQQMSVTIRVTDELRDCLAECARRLVRAGVWLEYRNVVRLAAASPVSALIAPPGRSVSASAGALVASGGTLQARTLRFVDAQGVVTSRQLVEFGTSRQMTNLMFKRGLLKRVQSGCYSVAHAQNSQLSLDR